MAFRLPFVNKCCCFTLRVGCLIIGYGILTLSIISIIAVITSLVFIVYFVKDHRDRPDLHHHSPEEVARAALSLYLTHAYYILVYLYHICINLLLIVGVHTDNFKYLRIYFKCGLVLLSLEVVLIVVTTVFIGPLVSLYSLVWSMLLFYFLIVVRSTAINMEENNKPRIRGYEMNSVYNPQQSTPLMA